MSRISSFIFFCFLLSTPMFSQVITSGIDESGRQGKHYRFVEFKSGKIIRNDGSSSQASLNYNYLTQEMIIDLGNTKIAYTELDPVKEFIVDSAVFMPYNGAVYEVLNDGDVRLLVHKKQLIEREGQQTGLGRTSGTYANNTNTYSTEPDQIPSYKEKAILYQLTLPGTFKLKDVITYHLLLNQEVTLLRRLQQMEKIFPENSDKIKKFIKNERLKNDRQEDILRLINFCNELAKNQSSLKE